MSAGKVPFGTEPYPAAASESYDGYLHHLIVVLRDDQLERIAEAVAARLAAAVPVEETKP